MIHLPEEPRVDVTCFLVLLLMLAPSQSVSASSALAEYEQPWEICALCHSLDGNSHMAKFPKLAGQRQGYIEKQLHDFLEGRRQNDGGQMSAIVTEIDADDLKPIAIWFSSQNHPAPADVDTDPAILELGQQLFSSNGCVQCHTSTLEDSASTIPRLESQHAQYLKKQLTDFQMGNRLHIGTDSTADPVLDLTDFEKASLAQYLAATPRQ